MGWERGGESRTTGSGCGDWQSRTVLVKSRLCNYYHSCIWLGDICIYRVNQQR